MKRTKRDRKPGRVMPHTDEAVKDDGTLDVSAMRAQIPEVIASFEKGEYTPVSHGVSDLTNGLEMYWLVRRKNPAKG